MHDNLSYQLEGNSQMTKTLEELFASRSQESQARIQEMGDDLLLTELLEERIDYEVFKDSHLVL